MTFVILFQLGDRERRWNTMSQIVDYFSKADSIGKGRGQGKVGQSWKFSG